MTVHVRPGERRGSATQVTIEIRGNDGTRTSEQISPEVAVQLASELVRIATDSIALRAVARGA